eukprot:4253362-Pleurochrysis_carterae.AAC.2
MVCSVRDTGASGARYTTMITACGFIVQISVLTGLRASAYICKRVMCERGDGFLTTCRVLTCERGDSLQYCRAVLFDRRSFHLGRRGYERLYSIDARARILGARNALEVIWPVARDHCRPQIAQLGNAASKGSLIAKLAQCTADSPRRCLVLNHRVQAKPPPLPYPI